MGAKKGKALALDLIDELLNEEQEVIEINSEKTAQHDFQIEVSDEPSPLMDLSASSIENEDTLDINRSDIGLNESSAPDATLHAEDQADNTMRVSNEAPVQTPQEAPKDDRVRASVGRFGTFRSSGQATATEAALAQSESLRIAQSRLLELEQEIERLRVQNEELAASAETFRRRGDELLAKNQKRERDFDNALETFEQEKQILQAAKEQLQTENEDLRVKNEELELRVTTNIQKIRVRERELENRLELVKMESAALIRSKDELVLELKRQADQLNLELNNYRAKNQELNRVTTDKQEMLRRTVKALRLALSMLEGEEDSAAAAKVPPVQRKAK